jgi:hypothetical protein
MEGGRGMKARWKEGQERCRTSLGPPHTKISEVEKKGGEAEILWHPSTRGMATCLEGGGEDR